MSSIMDVIGPEPSELSVLELDKLSSFDFVDNPASANIFQSAPDSVTIYMTNRSRISLLRV